MAIIDNVREVARLAQEVGKLDLYKQAVELMGQVTNLAAENLELKQQLHDLKAKLALRDAMAFRDGAYWKDGEDTPYCSRCFESDGKAVHLHAVGYQHYWFCTACKTKTGNPKNPPPPRRAPVIFGGSATPHDPMMG